MPKAYLFKSAEEFTEFVNVHRESRSSPNKELLSVTTPEGSFLVLLGFSPWGLSGLLSSWAKKEITLSAKQVQWKDGTRSVVGTVIERKQATSLTDFIALEHDPQPPADGHLYFLIEDELVISRLVRDSLRLGNDRINFATLSNGILLRIDQPSFFLLQEMNEDKLAVIYRQGQSDIFIRWGWRHPLESLWSKPTEEPREWMFLQPDHDPRRVSSAPWQDIYELISPTTDLPLATLHADGVEAPKRISVPLRLVATAKAPDPELWLLADSDLLKLEPLLAVLDQEDVVPYQVSIRHDDTGADLVFVREKISRENRRHLEFAGRGFAPFLGLNNLLLPAGWTLLPPLRRHVYRDLFRLQPENLTIVFPSEHGGLRILELPERSFSPLTSLIDYIVEGDATLLQERMESSIFDLGPWAAAPSHPGLARVKSDEVSKSSNLSTTTIPAPTVPVQEEEPQATDPTKFLREAPGLDESSLDALHRMELDLERAVIQRQTVSAWQELLKVKLALAKSDDALICGIEALWLMERNPSPEVSQALEGLAKAHFPDAAEALGCPPHPLHSRLAAFRLRSTMPDQDAPSAEIESWTKSMHVFLTTHQESLRIKESWLAWGWVLTKNGDKRKEIQLRDNIRSSICERGLSLENTPPFIRSRLFLDRASGAHEEGAKSGAAGNASSRAAAHLLLLQAALTKCKIPAFVELWNALLARAMARIGDLPAAARLASGLKRCPDSWTALFVSQAAFFIDPAQGESAQQHLTKTLTGGDATLVASIEAARKEWALREKMDNPSAFLAQENRERTYPKGGAAEQGPLMALKLQLDDAQRAGNEHEAANVMQLMMSLPEAKDYNDAVKLPQLIESLVSGLERYKWGLRGAGLIPVFTSFAQRVPGLIKQPDSFYAVVLRANLASGLLAADDPAGAVRQVNSSIRILNQRMGELDFIDACAAVVRSIEQLPLDKRGPLLTETAEAVLAQFSDSKSHFFTRPRLYCALVRCAEQIVEAAISKDRLSLELFRNYQLQDEFLILQRIQHETFSKP